MGNIEELLSPGDEGWRAFRDWASTSPRPVDVLPFEPDRRADCLVRIGVTTRSVMGALAWHTGGVLLDGGWLRLLGGVSARGLPDIATASADGTGLRAHRVIAMDVVGGRFAVNGGDLPADPGEVAYFGPDTLSWQPLGQSGSEFVRWALTGDVEAFYGDLRWSGWESLVRATPTGSLLSCYPPLFTAEAQQDAAAISRRAVPWREAVAFQDEMARQLADVPDGGSVVFSVEP